MKTLLFFVSIYCFFMVYSCTTTSKISIAEKPDVLVITKNRAVKEELRDDLMLMAHQSQPVTEILWDKWGVPHIYASTNKEIFYSLGYAQMHSHANTILKNFANSRGRAAAFFGEEHIQNDMMVHALDFPRIAVDWYHSQSSEFKKYIDEFVRGMNDYTTQVPGAVSVENRAILPVEKYDILQHALFMIYGRFVGGRDLQRAVRAAKDISERGSNAYAIAPKRSASGNAMLVMNPHLPWHDEWLFYEAHINAPGINTYGATLVGLPTLGIAFNENLGWSHTNNTIDNADTYELTLSPSGAGYILDGVEKPFDRRTHTLAIKSDDGKMSEKEITLLSSTDFGSVISTANGKAYSLKMPGFDQPHGIVQWWNMGIANDFNSFKNALKDIQIPFFNIMYADKQGNIFYLFNGLIPRRKHGGWEHWSGIVDGSKSENIWTDMLTYDELPKLENPETGWLQNANDPPWTATYPILLNPEDFKPYMAPVEMGFRPTRAVRMMLEDDSITFDELIDYKNSTRIEMADRYLDDLEAAVNQYGGQLEKEAMKVLNNWDREANADSRGMALFYQWAQKMKPDNKTNYSTPWSLADAFYSRQSLAEKQAAVNALKEVATSFLDKGIALDVPWGDVYRIKYNGKNLPGNGADGSVGIFRVAWSDGKTDDQGVSFIKGGDSWQAVIEFGERVRAKVLMSYGNSTQADSRNNGDQLELFARKEMRDCLFYKEDVLKNISLRESLIDGKFVVRR